MANGICSCHAEKGVRRLGLEKRTGWSSGFKEAGMGEFYPLVNYKNIINLGAEAFDIDLLHGSATSNVP
jgi:hypothetical protein